MSTARKITRAVALLVAAAITGVTLYYWKEQGCEFKSLCAAMIFHLGWVVAIWFTIDTYFKERDGE